jgi:hypothetical protein
MERILTWASAVTPHGTCVVPTRCACPSSTLNICSSGVAHSTAYRTLFDRVQEEGDSPSKYFRRFSTSCGTARMHTARVVGSDSWSCSTLVVQGGTQST